MAEYPAEKPSSYYRDPRQVLAQLIEAGPNRVLDVGCGEGRTGAALKASGRAAEVVGVEKNSVIAAIAQSHIDRVICADIEGLELPFAPGRFDYIVLADVLEHLVNPWTVVERLAELLREGGHIIASVPNVRHWRVVLPLILRGRWRYGPDGVLDDTHLRFFTRKSIVELFASSDLVLKRIVPEFRFMPKSKSNRLNRFTCALFEDFLAMRYVVDVIKEKHASATACAARQKLTT